MMMTIWKNSFIAEKLSNHVIIFSVAVVVFKEISKSTPYVCVCVLVLKQQSVKTICTVLEKEVS